MIDPIASLLDGTWQDPDGVGTIRVPVAAIVIERSLRGAEGDLVASLGFGKRLAVVSDATTHGVLGERVERALAGRASVVPVRLPAHPHADSATAESVRIACAACDALVAVGSGTLNDLCKYAAAIDGKPYAVFATAPSMNGYTSVNAAITVDGHKRSLPATAARGVFIDLAVFAAAPPRMIRAGIGDSLCRPTAQSDWLLSHHVRGTAYREAPFALLAGDEPAWLDAPEAVMAGDPDAMRALARTLVLSGLGMTLCGGSHPASQGEHLVSHYLDMFAPPSRGDYLHGEQVAVATLAVAQLQERLLAGEPPAARPTVETEATLAARFGEDVGRSCWREFAPKALTPALAEARNVRLREAWPDVREGVGRVALPAARIGDVLRRAGAPCRPEHVGVTPEFFARALREARFLRDRYTFLDLAGDSSCS